MSESNIGALFESLSKADNTADIAEGRMLRFILRQVRPSITPTELIVLLFIFDRTYTYGKPVESIPYRHFLEGVMSNGELLHPGVGLSLSTLKRALKALSDNDIIIAHSDRVRNKTSYMINPLWSPTGRNVIERKYNADRMAHQRAKDSSPVSLPCLTHDLLSKQEDSNMEIKTGAAVPHSVTSSLSNVIAKSNAARDRQKGKGNATALEKMWEDSYRAAYPDEQYFAWRVADKAAFKRALQRGGVPASSYALFIDFVVSEFPSVLSGPLKWMRNPPEYPTPRFVIPHIEVFYTAFRDKDDPNRKIRGAVSRAQPAAPAPDAGLAERKKLEEKLAAETAARLRAERERDQAKVETIQVRKQAAKKLVLRRPRTTEFGDWDD